jgi:hypothetical protein
VQRCCDLSPATEFQAKIKDQKIAGFASSYRARRALAPSPQEPRELPANKNGSPHWLPFLFYR